MKMKGLPLACSSWDKKEIEAIMSVIKKDRYTMGDAVFEFEKQFAQFFGSSYAVMVNSGSSANLLAIAALCFKKENPLKPGDEVIVPSLSWSTTYYPVSQYGMKLVFVDIDLETLNIDPTLIETAIGPQTKAIFVPDILGNPADLIKIKKICDRHNLYLIEDNCESMGAKLENRYAGTYGLMGTFSCFFSHHISTMEGGVIVTDNEELYQILLSLRAHGWTRQLPQKNLLCEKSHDPFYESFRFILPGYNLRPLEMSGAIGLEQLKKLLDLIRMRRENAKHFVNLFQDHPNFMIQKEMGESSWFGFSLIIRPESTIKREQILKIFAEHHIETRPIISGNFLRQPVIQYLDHRVAGEHKKSDLVHESGLFIGNHHVDIRTQLDHLAGLLLN
jgi:CDP-6-deoxy-D-xylo-4-hexulose-3-dehydrase